MVRDSLRKPLRSIRETQRSWDSITAAGIAERTTTSGVSEELISSGSVVQIPVLRTARSLDALAAWAMCCRRWIHHLGGQRHGDSRQPWHGCRTEAKPGRGCNRCFDRDLRDIQRPPRPRGCRYDSPPDQPANWLLPFGHSMLLAADSCQGPDWTNNSDIPQQEGTSIRRCDGGGSSRGPLYSRASDLWRDAWPDCGCCQELKCSGESSFWYCPRVSFLQPPSSRQACSDNLVPCSLRTGDTVCARARSACPERMLRSAQLVVNNGSAAGVKWLICLQSTTLILACRLLIYLWSGGDLAISLGSCRWQVMASKEPYTTLGPANPDC